MRERGEALITDALSRLDEEIEVPPVEPERERALLEAFDAYWAGARDTPRRWTWTAAAAMVAITVGLGWVVHRTPPVPTAPGDRPADITGFVPWPGAQALPPLESGELIRVGLPVSALPALGLLPPSPTVSVVQADIVIGQDGLARAVRLVQQ
jgi:hypothetical protein